MGCLKNMGLFLTNIFFNLDLKQKYQYSRVPNITVGLNKNVGVNFSWKLIKKWYQIGV